jgi:hypothetical protein
VHVFDEDTVAALHAAEVTGRPLLRGDPGTGKSETARAAAAERPFVSVVIDGRTEPTDLKWRFDAVARLADAQVAKADRPLKNERAYLLPGPLWWAYNWKSANERLDEVNCDRNHKLAAPGTPPEKWSPETGRAVLLIDEIDKADPDLPNALLEVLANLGFREPYGGTEVACTEATRPLSSSPPTRSGSCPTPSCAAAWFIGWNCPMIGTLIGWLVNVGARHQAALKWPAKCSKKLMQQAAAYVADARDSLAKTGRYLPGTSEFLDMIKVLATTPADMHDTRLAQLQNLALHKGGARHR